MENMINLYTRSRCIFCNRLKKMLDAEGIKYNDFDVSGVCPKKVIDNEGNIPVPQVDIGGMIIYDYKDENSLLDLIKSILNKETKA